MPANKEPIFTGAPDIQWALSPVTAANITTDLTSGTIYEVFGADATNGGFVQKLVARSLGTNASATVMRVWLNNGGATSVADNNALIDELTLPATTVSQVAAQAPYALPLGFAIPPGFRIFVTIGTAAAAGFKVTVMGGKY